MAKENGVILCLPPHCTHRLQPLDVSFMKPLSNFYKDEVRKWLRTNPGRVVTLHQIALLFGASYIRSATMTTAVNGFGRTGIWPVNINIFTKVDFMSSATIDIKIPLDETVAEGASSEHTQPSTLQYQIIQQPSMSTSFTGEESTITTFKIASPENILPIPKIDQTKKRKFSKRRGKAAVLTESPYKAQLLEEQNKKKMKAPSKRKLFSSPSKPKKAAKTKSYSNKKKC